MAKLPEPPAPAALCKLKPQILALPAGTTLARVYFAGGPYPTRWDEFRHYGPIDGRFDHHLSDKDGNSHIQDRAILYTAGSALTCFAEVFQKTRRIDRIRNAPHLAVFPTQTELRLLDLTSTFATRAGASMALNAGPRARTRRWAQAFYAAYPDLHGFYYASSMNAGEPAIALTERAMPLGVTPEFPEFDRSLNDDCVLDTLKTAADVLGYRLR